MRNPLVALLLLLLLIPVAWAAPKAEQRPQVAMAMRLDPDPDLLSLELPTLPLLRSAVRSLGLPEQDVEAMTQEQALLYLFVFHDYDRSGRLDGLELLQLLGAVLAQQDGGQPDTDMVAMLVDRTLEKQDLSRDGLLDPPELLVLSTHSSQGPPGQPLLQHPREALAGVLPGGDEGPPEGNTGVKGLGRDPAEGQAVPQAKVPDAEGEEVEEVLEVEGPDTKAMKAEEAPEAGVPEGKAAPVGVDAREE